MILRYEPNDVLKASLLDIFLATLPNKENTDKLKAKYFDPYFAGDGIIFYFKNNNKVLGYIFGSLKLDKDNHPYYKLINDELSFYEAHLHINCLPGYEGQGIGSKLLMALENELALRSVKGVHLVTLDGAKNVQFYLKNNYQTLTSVTHNGVSLLFLGKKLSNTR